MAEDKTQAQQALERLVAARNRLGESASRLEKTLVAIRGPVPVLDRERKWGGEIKDLRFLQGLEATAGEFEAIADAIEAGVRDLAQRF
jgi:hypothetical protein